MIEASNAAEQIELVRCKAYPHVEISKEARAGGRRRPSAPTHGGGNARRKSLHLLGCAGRNFRKKRGTLDLILSSCGCNVEGRDLCIRVVLQVLFFQVLQRGIGEEFAPADLCGAALGPLSRGLESGGRRRPLL